MTLQAFFCALLRGLMIVYVDSNCKKQQQLVYSVIEHCYAYLIPYDDVNINIHLKEELSDQLNGWCQHNSDNNYEICVDKSLPTDELIKTVCHEMVHVKQGVRNELVCSYRNKYSRLWLGTEYTDELPWEVEAYELENILFKTFMELDEKR